MAVNIEYKKMPRVTILVDVVTRDKLKAYGRKNQTYDQIIVELLEFRLKRSQLIIE